MVSAILWDADGILQQVPKGGWHRLLSERIGKDKTDELLITLWPTAQEAMCGRANIAEQLTVLLAEHGLTDVDEQIHEVWGTFDRFDDTRALVADVKNQGYGCHLATNQDQLRARYMRERLGYDDLMDSSFYSCEVGAMKPDPEYFVRVAQALDLDYAELAFVDDQEPNVVAAAELGIRAIHWHHDEGIVALKSALAELGISLA